MASSSQPFSLYEDVDRSQALIDRLKRIVKDDRTRECWESLLDSACAQLDSFDDEEYAKFQNLLISFMFLDGDFRRSDKAIRVCGGLLYHIISVGDINNTEDYLELMLRTSAAAPLDVSIHIHPLMFRAIVDKLRQDKPKDSLFHDEDIIRFATAFAMELGSSIPAEAAVEEYGAFWKAAFDTYAAEHCDSFDHKVLLVFLASRPYVQLYLRKSHDNQKKFYQCLVGTMEKKPTCISFKMGCLLLMYMWDLNFDEIEWKNVALYVKKLHGCSIHASASAATRDLTSCTINAFLNHSRAPREECIKKLQNHLKLEGRTENNEKSAPGAKSQQQSGDLEQQADAAKFVQYLLQLTEKMKAKGVRITTDSDKQKLRTVVRELNSFL